MCPECRPISKRLFGAGRTGLGAGSAAIALLMPKCPLCVAAWAWALSALGVDFDRWDQLKWPLTVAFLVLAVVLLGFKSRPWVKAVVLIGSASCLTYKVVQESLSLGIGVGIAVFALTGLFLSQFGRSLSLKGFRPVTRPNA